MPWYSPVKYFLLQVIVFGIYFRSKLGDAKMRGEKNLQDEVIE